MPGPFDITTATNTIPLDNKREGTGVFTVRNATRRRLHATVRVSTMPPEGAQWITILPPEGGDPATANQRDFPIDSTQQIQVKIAVPPTAAPATYTMKLTLADEVNPDENFSTSPDVVFTVREIPKEEPRKFPVWVIPVIVIAVLVIGGIIIGGIALSRPQPTPTPPAPCVIVVTAPTNIYQIPVELIDYLQHQVQSGEMIPMGRLADNSWWQLNYVFTNSWIPTSAFGVTAQTRGDCLLLPIITYATPTPFIFSG